MRFRRGPLGPLLILLVTVLLLCGTAVPASADDPKPAPRAVTVPRAPQRAVPVGASYDQLVTYATETARDLTDLSQQARDVAARRDTTLAQRSELEALTRRPSLVRDRLEREALRLSARPSSVSDPTLSPAQREAADEMLAVRTELQQRIEELQAVVDAYASFPALAPKTGPWMSPAQGRITQAFGPTRLRVEPALVYEGLYYAHFHAGIDIGAPMYSPIVAAAPGRVAFAGRMADGAMVVVIAHAGGLVSLYAHLDDRIAPPRVNARDEVSIGQVIGAVGMTGMTTGPHLHFSVWRDGALVDPLSLFAH